MHDGKLSGFHLTADGRDELVIADDAIAVFVEVFENALEFGHVQFHAKLAENPLDFVTVKNAVSVLIHLYEKLRQDAHAMLTLLLKGREDLVENLLWGVSV